MCIKYSFHLYLSVSLSLHLSLLRLPQPLSIINNCSNHQLAFPDNINTSSLKKDSSTKHISACVLYQCIIPVWFPILVDRRMKIEKVGITFKFAIIPYNGDCNFIHLYARKDRFSIPSAATPVASSCGRHAQTIMCIYLRSKKSRRSEQNQIISIQNINNGTRKLTKEKKRKFILLYYNVDWN